MGMERASWTILAWESSPSRRDERAGKNRHGRARDFSWLDSQKSVRCLGLPAIRGFGFDFRLSSNIERPPSEREIAFS